MWDMFKARAACGIVMQTLSPFAASSYESGIDRTPAGLWMNPHVLGFLSQLVTLITLRERGALRVYAMAWVQASVIGSLTGAGQELIGERIHLYSSTNDEMFSEGCKAAFVFFEILAASTSRAGVGQPLGRDDEDRLKVLWKEHISTHLHSAHPSA